MRLPLSCVLALAGVFVSQAVTGGYAAADSGDFDPTFGDNGTVFLHVPLGLAGGYGDGHVSVSPDGGAMVAGNDHSSEFGDDRIKVRLSKLDSHGDLDGTFSSDGELVWRHARRGPDSGTIVRALTVLPDGRIQFEGTFYNGDRRSGYAARLLPNGDPDVSFGVDGSTRRRGPEYAYFSDFARDIQPDGGVDRCTTRGDVTYLTRDLPDGTPDATFSNDGRRRLDIDIRGWSIQNTPQACGRTAGGKLVVVFYATDLTGAPAHVIARLRPNGHLDRHYGTDGLMTTPPTPIEARDIIVLDDGRVTISGAQRPPDADHPNYPAVYKLRRSGKPDGSYGGGDAVAVSTLALAGSVGEIHAEERIDGTVTLGGDGDFHAFLARFTPSGEPDVAFGDGGVNWDLYNTSSRLNDFMTDTDGRIVSVSTGNSFLGQLAVSRFTS